MLETVTAQALDFQGLARALVELSIDPAVLRCAEIIHARAVEQQETILTYREERKAKKKRGE